MSNNYRYNKNKGRKRAPGVKNIRRSKKIPSNASQNIRTQFVDALDLINSFDEYDNKPTHILSTTLDPLQLTLEDIKKHSALYVSMVDIPKILIKKKIWICKC